MEVAGGIVVGMASSRVIEMEAAGGIVVGMVLSRLVETEDAEDGGQEARCRHVGGSWVARAWLTTFSAGYGDVEALSRPQV